MTYGLELKGIEIKRMTDAIYQKRNK